MSHEIGQAGAQDLQTKCEDAATTLNTFAQTSVNGQMTKVDYFCFVLPMGRIRSLFVCFVLLLLVSFFRLALLFRCLFVPLFRLFRSFDPSQ